jgi:hypothetical protein
VNNTHKHGYPLENAGEIEGGEHKTTEEGERRLNPFWTGEAGLWGVDPISPAAAAAYYLAEDDGETTNQKYK